MRLTQFFSRALLALALIMGFSTAALSVAATEWIENPLPIEYRKHAGELLKTIRSKDSDRALENAKAILWSAQNINDTYIIIRVEFDCPDGYCMTLVGRIENEAIALKFLLQAGPTVHFGDVSFELWGSKTAPSLTFEARGGAGVIAVLREQEWILTACANCTGNVVKLPPRPAPLPVPKFDTYESFRHALKKQGLNR